MLANLFTTYLGRVAAGAIAEKYLKEAHGIEIVAFVSSVGKIHLPSSNVTSSVVNDDGDTDDALSPEFRTLLATLTREEVDKFPTRCPHIETSERMTKVGSLSFLITGATINGCLAYYPSQGSQRLNRRNCHLRHSQRSRRAWRTRF
jgi:hypothetical protein